MGGSRLGSRSAGVLASNRIGPIDWLSIYSNYDWVLDIFYSFFFLYLDLKVTWRTFASFEVSHAWPWQMYLAMDLFLYDGKDQTKYYSVLWWRTNEGPYFSSNKDNVNKSLEVVLEQLPFFNDKEREGEFGKKLFIYINFKIKIETQKAKHWELLVINNIPILEV
jgi:hypothetical protein